MVQGQGKFAAAGDALISVTVYKTTANQKAGIKVIQKPDGGIYITAIAKGGLLDGTRIDVGDKLLSINGRRMIKGQDTREFMKLISTANEKITIVVKKNVANKKQNKAASKSPGTARKIVKAEKYLAKDGSFDYNINPKLEEFQKSLSKLNDDKNQIPIKTRKLYPDQGAGLAFKKKDDKLFVSGITSDSLFVDTDLEFGDRIVAVMDVNFMNFADGDYAKTLLKRAKGDVSIIIEKGWSVLDKKKDLDRRHNMVSLDSIRMPKKTAKVFIVKNKDVAPSMESLAEAGTDEKKDSLPPSEEDEWRRKAAEENGLLLLSTESSPTSSRKTLERENENGSPIQNPNRNSWWNVPTLEGAGSGTDETQENNESTTANNESTPDKSSSTPRHPIMNTLPSPASPKSDKKTPSSVQNEASSVNEKSPANGKPRKFLPPMIKESKKNYSRGEVDAGDVVSRMLNKLDNERKAIKERHRMRLNQSFDESADGSQEGTPKKSPNKSSSTPKRVSGSGRTYTPVKSYASPSSNSGHFSSPTSTGLSRNLRKHQHGYLCISVRKKSERSPGIKLRRKDDIFILDRLPHDETRIPVGVQVLAVNGNDSFSTVVKANELIDSRKQEVELCVSFEGLIAAWASGDSGQ